MNSSGSIGEISTAAAERARGANDHRKTQPLLNAHGIAHAAGVAAARQVEADTPHGFFEQIAVFGLFNRVDLGADHLDAVMIEDAFLGEIDGKIQRRLASERRQDCIGSFLGDDFLDDISSNRLDVSARGKTRVGHDRCRIGVNENDSIAFFLQRLQRLGAGIVELTGLADDDRSRANEENGIDVGSLGHGIRWFGDLPSCR